MISRVSSVTITKMFIQDVVEYILTVQYFSLLYIHMHTGIYMYVPSLIQV